MIQGRGPGSTASDQGWRLPAPDTPPRQGGSPRGRFTKFQVCSPRSTSARAMRAQLGTIHTNSIRASPSRTMRDEMTSPNRSPPGRRMVVHAPPSRAATILTPPGRRTAGRSREADGGVRRLPPPGRRTAEATAGVRHEKWRPGRIVPSRTRLHHCENRGIMRKMLNPPGVPVRTILPGRQNGLRGRTGTAPRLRIGD